MYLFIPSLADMSFLFSSFPPLLLMRSQHYWIIFPLCVPCVTLFSWFETILIFFGYSTWCSAAQPGCILCALSLWIPSSLWTSQSCFSSTIENFWRFQLILPHGIQKFCPSHSFSSCSFFRLNGFYCFISFFCHFHYLVHITQWLLAGHYIF